jgi:Rha family phage regulatory protein
MDLAFNVIQAIENLECSQDFNERNFAFVEYEDPTGRTLPMYKMTRDGFSFLVLKFTGSYRRLGNVRYRERREVPI